MLLAQAFAKDGRKLCFNIPRRIGSRREYGTGSSCRLRQTAVVFRDVPRSRLNEHTVKVAVFLTSILRTYVLI